MQYAILQYDICPAHGGVQGNQTAAGDGTQASRLRNNSQPSAAGETPAYQRESSLPTAAGENLHCELLAFTNDMGIKLVRHDLPDGCKDFADYWVQQSVHRTPVPT